MRTGALVVVVLLAGLAAVFYRGAIWGPTSAGPAPQTPPERYAGLVPPFAAAPPDTGSLRDLYGNARSLTEFVGLKAVVLCFLGSDCPVANRLLPSLKRLEREFRPQDVQFLAIYSNEPETIDDAAAHATEFDLPFPVWKDYGQKLADTLGVERTPEFCVLDGAGALVYRGRFNDRYAVGTTKQEPAREDLQQALREVVAMQRVEVSQTQADGCLLQRTAPGKAPDQVNYVDHVAPILQQHCEACHRAGSMGPFALSNYDDARQWAEMIKEVAQQRRMPPWHADARHNDWANDRRLTVDQVATLAAWADQGMPPGDLSKFVPRTWSSEWEIGEVDAVIEAEKAFEVPAEGVIPYQYIWASKEETAELFQEDRWLIAADVKPGAPQVVHHLMVFAVAPGFAGPHESYDGCTTAGSYLPGTPSFYFPPDTALKIPKGARICFEMHYTPNGKAAVDKPRIALKFMKRRPAREMRIAALQSRKISIPPGEPHFMMEGKAAAPVDSQMLALFPHQHMRGKSFKFVAHFPDGRHETLLSVPRMDYFWQTIYWFKDPPFIPQGTVINCIGHWDNSPALAGNPDPQATVRWGPQSTDEMFVAWLFFVDKPR